MNKLNRRTFLKLATIVGAAIASPGALAQKLAESAIARPPTPGRPYPPAFGLLVNNTARFYIHPTQTELPTLTAKRACAVHMVEVWAFCPYDRRYHRKVVREIPLIQMSSVDYLSVRFDEIKWIL